MTDKSFIIKLKNLSMKVSFYLSLLAATAAAITLSDIGATDELDHVELS